MTRVRIALVAAIACMAIGGTVVSDAVAAPGTNGSANVTQVPPLYKLHVNGVSKDGKKFRGTYGIQRFVVATVNGKKGVYSLGTLKGMLGGHRVSRNNVMLPARLTGANNKLIGAKTSPRQVTTSCTILHLVLGPINLNLLGLQVTLGGGPQANQVIVLDLTAHRGQGLLGDLLCGLDNALGGGTVLSQLSTELQNLAATLDSLVSLLGGL
jgi:hypothetical protein